MVLIKRNFAGNNSSVFGKEFFKFLGCLVLGDLSHECVVLLELGDISAEEILEVGQSTTGLAFEAEVSEIVFDTFELFLVVKFENCGVEGFGEITTNLGYLLHINTTYFLDFSGELD